MIFIQSLSTLIKELMIDPAKDLSPEVDIHQKRLFLRQPEAKKVRLITNIFVYCAHYYPLTRSLARDVTRMLGETHLKEIYQAFQALYACLEREIVNGPSSSFIPASQLPVHAKNDVSFPLHNSPTEELPMFYEVFDELGLEALIPRRRVKELLWYNCSKFLSMKNVQGSKFFLGQFLEELEIEGQSWIEATPFPGLVVLLENLLQLVVVELKPQGQYERNFKLMRARLAYLHNRQLKSPVKKLCDVVLGSYREVLSLSLKVLPLQDYVQLLLEYAFTLLFYYKYSQSERILRHCSKLLNMEIQFTGRLGRRTKYQVFDTPLLFMQLVSSPEKTIQKEIHDVEEEDDNQKIDLIDAKQLILKERGTPLMAETGGNVAPVAFDDESILLETPKFVEGEAMLEGNILKEINQQHLLVALGILYFEWRSTPHDEMLMQSITAAVSTLLGFKIKTSFSFSFALLLLRSLNEFPRIKNAERALDQLQKLKQSFNGKADKSTSDLYSTPFETHLGFILILAEKYIELGLSITAVELFEQAGLYEQCVDGLIAKNYREKALEIANRLIQEKGKNPRLLCMLGDIYKDKEIHYYEEAWELSKGTYARAQRSLGWHYFGKNDFEKAAQSFSKATQASYYHPSTWFTLGCTYMRLNQFDKALKSFSECISIDETQGEAWGNMASCYMYEKKPKEAYSTLCQAVKYSEGNWKLWANLLSVSLSLKKFYKFFESIQRVVILGHPQILIEDIMKKVAQVMQYQNQIPGRKRILYSYKNRIDRLFGILQEKIGQNPLVWRGKVFYFIELLEYLQDLYTHYSDLHAQNKVDPNDLIPGYETPESTAQQGNPRIYQTREKIVDFKQCELNMTMRIGWEGDKQQCRSVRAVLEEYVETYRKYSSKHDKQDFRLFIDGVVQKIAECMEEPYKIGLEWL